MSTEAQAKKIPAPSKAPVPHQPESPMRGTIPKVTDTVANMVGIVNGLTIDADVKKFIVTELGKLKSNAVTLCLFDVAAPDGGFDLHLCLRPAHLGLPPKG